VSETPATTTAPGFYPDPWGGPVRRWWDGVQWTDQLESAATVTVRAPEGTRPGTVWAWLIALIPIVPTTLWGVFDWRGLLDGTLDVSPALASQFGQLAHPIYASASLTALLVQVGTILFAYFDYRALLARQIPLPLHWAWSFFTFAGAGNLVYMIGRAVVVRRRTGRGTGPLWAAIAVLLATIAVYAMIAVIILEWIADVFPIA